MKGVIKHFLKIFRYILIIALKKELSIFFDKKSEKSRKMPKNRTRAGLFVGLFNVFTPFFSARPPRKNRTRVGGGTIVFLSFFWREKIG
jgi:hypothetical protein